MQRTIYGVIEGLSRIGQATQVTYSPLDKERAEENPTPNPFIFLNHLNTTYNGKRFRLYEEYSGREITGTPTRQELWILPENGGKVIKIGKTS